MDYIDNEISIPFCFDNRKYDSHLLHPKCTAYNLSYNDIYGFCQKKQNLKKMFVKYLEGYKGGKINDLDEFIFG